jgi:ethanolamine phosphate transferase 2 subunit G
MDGHSRNKRVRHAAQTLHLNPLIRDIELIKTSSKSDKEALRKFQSLVLILASTRLVRAWNQTGQKFAGAPDLVKLFLEPRPNELWVFVGLTYLWEHGALLDGYNAAPKIVSVGGITGLILMAFIFKLAFAKEDAPELVLGWVARVEEVAAGTPLLARARALFIALGIAAGAVIFYGITRRKLSTKTPGQSRCWLYIGAE